MAVGAAHILRRGLAALAAATVAGTALAAQGSGAALGALARLDRGGGMDHGEIAFIANTTPPGQVFNGDGWELQAVHSDGSALLHLVGAERGLVDGGDFAWSPTGDRIAFSVRGSIRVVTLADHRVATLTTHPLVAVNDYAPTWSPDGRTILFTSDRGGRPALYVMSAVGSNVKRLYATQGTDAAGAWSPDGRRIAFVTSVTVPAWHPGSSGVPSRGSLVVVSA